MAKRNITATYNDTHVIVSIKKSAAKNMAVLLEDAGDWFGNAEPEDLGMTAKQYSSAEDNIYYLSELLNG